MHDFGGKDEKSVKTENCKAPCESKAFRTDARTIGDSSVNRHWTVSAPLRKEAQRWYDSWCGGAKCLQQAPGRTAYAHY